LAAVVPFAGVVVASGISVVSSQDSMRRSSD